MIAWLWLLVWVYVWELGDILCAYTKLKLILWDLLKNACPEFHIVGFLMTIEHERNVGEEKQLVE